MAHGRMRHYIVMFRNYALGFLIPPAFWLLFGWVNLQAGYVSETGFFLFIALPALVMVVGWAALAAHAISIRRERQH
jgi:hypothetical protein